MFQILGAWAGGESGDGRTAVMLDDHSRRHAWHSTVWFDRLPELSNVDAPGLVVAPSVLFAEMLDEVAGLTDPIDQLTVAYEVLATHLVVTYRRELVRLDDIGDATSRHWLGFILQNLTEELLQAASLLDGLVGADADVDRSTSARSVFAKKLLACGGISTPR